MYTGCRGPRIRTPHPDVTQARQVRSNDGTRPADALPHPHVRPVDAGASGYAGKSRVLKPDLPSLFDQPAGDEVVVVGMQEPDPVTKERPSKVLAQKRSDEFGIRENLAPK